MEILEKLKILKKTTIRSYLFNLYSIFLIFVPILISLDKYIGVIGTILTGIPFVLGILCVFLSEKKKIIKYIVIIILLSISTCFTTNISKHFDFIKTLLIFLTCLDMVQDINFLNTIKKYLIKYYKFIIISIFLILALNLIILVTGDFSDNYSQRWNIEAFKGVYDDPHQAAYRLCSLIVYIIFFIKYNKGNVILNLFLLFTTETLLLMTGARTPTALGLFLALIGILMFREQIKNIAKKYKKTFILLTLLLIIAIAIIFPNTAFIQKSLNTKEGNFDNGRFKLLTAQLEYFMQTDLINKFLGSDVAQIYQINYLTLHNQIWCHNDIMQILLQFGIVMLVIYLETIILSMIKLLKIQKNNIDKIMIVLLNLIFIFVAFYNGLFYFPRFVITIPIIFLFYSLNDKEEEK